jgi:hypothetical protein
MSESSTNDNLPFAKLRRNYLNQIYDKDKNLKRLINKEIIIITNGVLHQNNLGMKKYNYTYTYTYNDSLPVDDYFSQILNKVIEIFDDSEIHITSTLPIYDSNEINIVNNHNGNSNLDRQNSRVLVNQSGIAERPIYKNELNNDVINTIEINWG